MQDFLHSLVTSWVCDLFFLHLKCDAMSTVRNGDNYASKIFILRMNTCPMEQLLVLQIVVLIIWLTSFFLYGFALSSIPAVDYRSVEWNSVVTNVIFTIEQTKENVCACDKPIDFHKFVSFDGAN